MYKTNIHDAMNVIEASLHHVSRKLLLFLQIKHPIQLTYMAPLNLLQINFLLLQTIQDRQLKQLFLLLDMEM